MKVECVTTAVCVTVLVKENKSAVQSVAAVCFHDFGIWQRDQRLHAVVPPAYAQ